MESEHYASDVPRLTRIVEPVEHAGKLIMNVTTRPHSGGRRWVEVVITTDTGEAITFLMHDKIKVEKGLERVMKEAWARAVASGEHPPVADEQQVNEIAETLAGEWDSTCVYPANEVGEVLIEAMRGDVVTRRVTVRPDGTVDGLPAWEPEAS
jgi:hypothetical protein